jgi:glycosyltransferase involved in cell wall biosynthesis
MSGELSPMVSVCIPTYNYGQFVAETVDSVLAQTYRDIEILVVDNCSTDNTFDVLRPYIDEGRIRYVCNDTNLGMVGNWNRCIELARGRYVKILCADDLLEASALEESVAMFEKHSGVAVVAFSRTIVDNGLKPLRIARYAVRSGIVPGSEAVRRCFLCGNLIGEPTAVMFRHCDAERGFNPEYRQIVDLEMWMHLLGRGDMAFISTPLCKIRQHEEQLTKESVRTFVIVEDEKLLYRDYSVKPFIGDSLLVRERWRLKLACMLLHHAEFGIDPAEVRRRASEFYPPMLVPLRMRLDFLFRCLGGLKRLIVGM